MRHPVEPLERGAPVVAEPHRVVVDVHQDEAPARLLVDARARSASRTRSPRPRWRTRSRSSRAAPARAARCIVLAEVAAHHVDAERQRQAATPSATPRPCRAPCGGPCCWCVICPSWISRPEIRLPLEHRLGDLVEGDLDDRRIARRRGAAAARPSCGCPGWRPPCRSMLLAGDRLARDEDRPVALPHRRAGIHHAVLLVHQRVGRGGHRRHLELAGAGAPVERLDVLEHVLDLDVAGLHLARGERVEHEGVVGVRAVADADRAASGVSSVSKVGDARPDSPGGARGFRARKGITGPSWTTSCAASAHVEGRRVPPLPEQGGALPRPRGRVLGAARRVDRRGDRRRARGARQGGGRAPRGARDLRAPPRARPHPAARVGEPGARVPGQARSRCTGASRR